ncbi:MAG: hypothetical protein WC852_05285 [Candidatus Nanoarchaeia archaeon]|jgi:hypothetical protein
MLEIIYASTMKEATEAVKNGFEPVECSFGREGTAVGKYKLDHHGAYSSEEAVSLKAARLALNGVKLEQFVVAGAADCDQCYAIASLGSLIPVNLAEAEAVAEIDVDPIGRDFTSEKYVRMLMFDQKTRNMPNCLESTLKSLDVLVEIFNGRYTAEDVRKAAEDELQRKEEVKKGIKMLLPGKVALVHSADWGYDVWYESAPIVVSYAEAKKAVTIGLCPKKGGTLGNESGFDILGEEGLKRVFPKLDSLIKQGWGGRETIGGSPRNVDMSYEDAVKAYEIIREIVLAS